MPPPNGSIGSITDGSKSTAETFRQQNWRTPTTVKPSPAIRSGAQKQSDRTRRGDSRCAGKRGSSVLAVAPGGTDLGPFRRVLFPNLFPHLARRLAQLTVRAPSGCGPQIRPGERAPRYPMCPGMDERPYKLSTPLSAHVRPKECEIPAKRCVRGARAGSRKP